MEEPRLFALRDALADLLGISYRFFRHLMKKYEL
jgi:hypothetical protein